MQFSNEKYTYLYVGLYVIIIFHIQACAYHFLIAL